MARLVRIDKGKEKQVTHKKCGAVIAYFEREVKSSVYEDYGGGRETWYHIKCPNCGEKVEVSKPSHM